MGPPEESLLIGVRAASRQLAESLGYEVNSALPLLDGTTINRSAKEIASRAMVLHTCCAASHGFSAVRALQWLAENKLLEHMSPKERRFLHDGTGGEPWKVRPEAIWALAWVVGKVPSFALQLEMTQNAVMCFPNLKIDENAAPWTNHSVVRDDLSVLKALDFYYCVHWALIDAGLRRWPAAQPLLIPTHVVIERRRALEWCFGSESWDDTELDT